MLSDTPAYSGIAVRDMEAARRFYGGTLGLRTSEERGVAASATTASTRTSGASSGRRDP